MTGPFNDHMTGARVPFRKMFHRGKRDHIVIRPPNRHHRQIGRGDCKMIVNQSFRQQVSLAGQHRFQITPTLNLDPLPPSQIGHHTRRAGLLGGSPDQAQP